MTRVRFLNFISTVSQISKQKIQAKVGGLRAHGSHGKCGEVNMEGIEKMITRLQENVEGYHRKDA